MCKVIIIVVVRISAVAFFLYGIQRLGDNYFLLSRFLDDGESIPIIFILLIFFPLFISLFLWSLSKKIASAVVKGLSEQSLENKAKAEQIREVAFSVVGIVLLVYALSKLLSWIYWYAIFDPDKYDMPDLVGLGIVVIVNIGAGAWLLFGSRGIANLVRMIRYAGIDK